eukprot:3614720-Lingulodinium_polyedra.AAC.1
MLSIFAGLNALGRPMARGARFWSRSRHMADRDHLSARAMSGGFWRCSTCMDRANRFSSTDIRGGC